MPPLNRKGFYYPIRDEAAIFFPQNLTKNFHATTKIRTTSTTGEDPTTIRRNIHEEIHAIILNLGLPPRSALIDNCKYINHS